MILLQVAPSSPGAAWSAAEEEAGRLVAKLNSGADFSDLARLQSADDSAKEGGDLGYVHRGMIPEGLQGGIDRMSPGEISGPIRVLQGMTVFKLIDRQAARQLAFEVSKPRARDLYVRERSDQTWNSFLAQLRGKAKIEINTQRYPVLVPQDSGSK
jgi:parvulin-like peptidyl-prolyl isomerase